MKRPAKPFSLLVILFLPLLVMQSCASLQEASGSNTRTFDKSYEDLVPIVERIINGSNVKITYADDSEDGVMTLIINREAHISSSAVQQDQGTVRIRRLMDGQSEVEVENPDYHFSVPDSKKINYRRLIFKRLDEELNS